jgi:hypothetical protein
MDERIRLLLDLGQSKEEAEKVVAALDRMKVSAKGVADTYEVLTTVINRSVGAAGSYEIATDRVDHALDEHVRKALEVTQAQKAMNMVMGEFGSVATAAMGSGQPGGGMAGRGILGASYAIQDFTSVLTGGGGLARALGSVSNNIDQMAMAAGASVATAAKLSIAFTGLTATMPFLIPLFQKLWEAMTGEGEKGPAVVVKALDDAKERVEAIQASLDQIMKSRPMQERETAGQVKELFAEEGAEHIVRGLGSALGQSGRGAQMTDRQKQELALAETQARDAQSSVLPSVRENAARNLQSVRTRIAGEMKAENQRMAGEMIGSAPTSAASRRQIGELARGFPAGFPAGFAGHLAEMEPEVMAAQDADEGPGSDAFAERAKKGGEARRVARKRKDAEEKAMEGFLREEAAQSKKGLAALARKAKENREVRDLEEAFARTGEEFAAAERNPSAAAQRRRRKAGVEAQAGQLMQHGPEIVGQAFGPQAAMRASNANPAEVQAMKAQTIQNLEAGQFPADAVLNAFREVAEASIRNARQTQGFVGQMNGIAQQTKRSLEQSAMPSGLQR